MAGRTAVLTGVTGGWGRAVLDRFLAQGWDVCATTHSGGVDVPSEVLVVEADLTDTAAAERVVAAALERFGSVDALGCVAGGFRAWPGRCRSRRPTTGGRCCRPTSTPPTP